MTTEGLGTDLGTTADTVTPAEAFDLCDRIVGEPSRRQHLFGWLRAPEAPRDQWLPVDAYYPRHRLVLVWRQAPGPNDELYRQLVPAHGLRLLELTPAKIAGDRQEAERRLRALLGAAGATPIAAAPRPPRPPQPGPRVAPAAESNDIPERARPPAPPSELPAWVGAIAGVALAAVVLAELYAGVAVIGFGAGRPVLAVGLALDACARALGTLAASRERAGAWPWACAVGGSPLVAAFVFGRERRAKVEPAPLAGVLSLLALALVAVALIGIAS
jgi:hypothetical protein